VDEEFGIKIGEAHRKDYYEFVKQYVQNPENKMLRASFHPSMGLADKFDSAYASAFVASMMKGWYPEWSREIYDAIRDNYVGNFELDMGAYVLESLPESAEGKLRDITSMTEPGMIGEGALAIALMWVASRDFDDAEVFNGINKTITNVTRPKWVESEIRSTDEEPSGIGEWTMGNLYNMFMGWSLFAKVHLGWNTMIEYDWSKNRDSQGMLMDYGASKQTPP
jgi:hypothetical protein